MTLFANGRLDPRVQITLGVLALPLAGYFLLIALDTARLLAYGLFFVCIIGGPREIFDGIKRIRSKNN